MYAALVRSLQKTALQATEPDCVLAGFFDAPASHLALLPPSLCNGSLEATIAFCCIDRQGLNAALFWEGWRDPLACL